MHKLTEAEIAELHDKTGRLRWKDLRTETRADIVKLVRAVEHKAELATLDEAYSRMGKLVADSCCDKAGQHYGIASCREVITELMAPLVKS